MDKELKERVKDALECVPIDVQLAALRDCAEQCFLAQDAEIFKQAMDILTGEAVYEDGQLKYLCPFQPPSV